MTVLWYNLLISVRNLLRNKFYLFVNVGGLAVGMACSLLIYLWVADELSADRFFKNYQDVYRVNAVSYDQGNLVKSENVPCDLGSALKSEFPEIMATTCYHRESQRFLKYKDRSVNVWTRDITPEFFTVFPFSVLEGNAQTITSSQIDVRSKTPMTKAQNGIVLSEKIAKKLFGKEPAMGKVLQGSYDGVYTVLGVIKVPENTHFDFEILNVGGMLSEDKFNSVYIRLVPGTKLTTEKKEKLSKVIAFQSKKNIRLTFQPLSEIYINTPWEENGNLKPHGNYQSIVLMSAIAFIILLIAALNYLNLSIAQALKRTREIGIKKVIGSLKSQIITGMVAEYGLVSLLALLLAIYLAGLFLPAFNQMSGKTLVLVFDTKILLYGLGILLITGLVSVAYPAIYISNLQPEVIFKQQTQHSKSVVRKSFIVLQLGLSFFITISALFFNFQMHYIANKDLGYKKDNVVIMYTGSYIYSYRNLRDDLLKNPNIVNVSASCGELGNFVKLNKVHNVTWEGKNPADTVDMYNLPVDPDYLSTTGIQMVKGEFLPNELNITGYFRWTDGKDSSYNSPVVINETAARIIGFQNPIGELLNNDRIIGVVKDFYFRPLKEKVEPLIFSYNPEGFWTLNIRIRPENKAATLSFIEKASAQYRGDRPFEYSFLDDDIKANYRKESNITQMFNYASGISILLAFMGVFALVSFLTESRRKEISLRKVSGALTKDIIQLFSIDFLVLTGIAFAIATPFTWIFMKNWLSNFAYHTPLSLWVFFACGISIALITIVTVAFQTSKIATENPVNNLRHE